MIPSDAVGGWPFTVPQHKVALRLRIETYNPPLAPEDIQYLEKVMNARLPEVYSEFLLHYNGGVPYANTFDVKSNLHDKFLYSFVIRKFLGVNTKGQDDIVTVWQSLKGKLPLRMIPIAIDHFRNFMCLGMDTGEIFFYDLQGALKSGKPGKAILFHLYIFRVATSFEAMLEELYHKKFS